MRVRAFSWGAVVGLCVVTAVAGGCSDSGPKLDPNAYYGIPGQPAVWAGTIEAEYAFNSGSKAVALYLTGPTSGTVVFGAPSGGAWSPTDPGAVFPPGCTPSQGFAFEIVNRGTDLKCMEGFEFTMRDVKWDSDRLRFSFDLNDSWGDWCKSQTFVVHNAAARPPYYTCAAPPDRSRPACTIGSDDGEKEIDCDHLAGCEQRCACTESACDRAAPRSWPFDLNFQGQRATGSTPFGTLVLTRQ